MSNYVKIAKQDIENVSNEKFFDGVSNEKRELFKRAILESMDSKIRIIEEEIKDIELPPPSRRHKQLMNRLFREHLGGSFLPFSEEDNLCESKRDTKT